MTTTPETRGSILQGDYTRTTLPIFGMNEAAITVERTMHEEELSRLKSDYLVDLVKAGIPYPRFITTPDGIKFSGLEEQLTKVKGVSDSSMAIVRGGRLGMKDDDEAEERRLQVVEAADHARIEFGTEFSVIPLIDQLRIIAERNHFPLSFDQYLLHVELDYAEHVNLKFGRYSLMDIYNTQKSNGLEAADCLDFLVLPKLLLAEDLPTGVKNNDIMDRVLKQNSMYPRNVYPNLTKVHVLYLAATLHTLQTEYAVSASSVHTPTVEHHFNKNVKMARKLTEVRQHVIDVLLNPESPQYSNLIKRINETIGKDETGSALFWIMNSADLFNPETLVATYRSLSKVSETTDFPDLYENILGSLRVYAHHQAKLNLGPGPLADLSEVILDEEQRLNKLLERAVEIIAQKRNTGKVDPNEVNRIIAIQRGHIDWDYVVKIQRSINLRSQNLKRGLVHHLQTAGNSEDVSEIATKKQHVFRSTDIDWGDFKTPSDVIIELDQARPYEKFNVILRWKTDPDAQTEYSVTLSYNTKEREFEWSIIDSPNDNKSLLYKGSLAVMTHNILRTLDEELKTEVIQRKSKQTVVHPQPLPAVKPATTGTETKTTRVLPQVAIPEKFLPRPKKQEPSKTPKNPFNSLSPQEQSSVEAIFGGISREQQTLIFVALQRLNTVGVGNPQKTKDGIIIRGGHWNIELFLDTERQMYIPLRIDPIEK